MQTREGMAPDAKRDLGPSFLKALDLIPDNALMERTMKRLAQFTFSALAAIVSFALYITAAAVVLIEKALDASFGDFLADELGSISLSAAAIASFDSEVKHAYQDMGKLRDTVRVRTGVTGSTHRFNKLGAGLATRRVKQTDVVPMNLQHTNATVTLEDWNAAEYTDVFDEGKTNISERAELAGSIAKAISRREDQLIIDALEATATTLTVASSVGGANTDLNVDKLRRASRLLGDNGVGEEEELTYVGSYVGREAMLGETEATSADYNTVRALVNGDINSFVGFNFKWIATRSEGGLDLTSGDRSTFAYAKSAVGHAIGMDQRMEINYIPTKTSWLANMLFSGGSVEIDAGGVVDITCDENG